MVANNAMLEAALSYVAEGLCSLCHPKPEGGRR